jgi:hypothetical protein
LDIDWKGVQKENRRSQTAAERRSRQEQKIAGHNLKEKDKKKKKKKGKKGLPIKRAV